MPTDQGLLTCPDCGGEGALASPAALVDWRLSAIELAQHGRIDETAMDLRWLAFEVRRSRSALTELLALIDDMEDSPLRTRMRFVANGALNIYEAAGRKPPDPDT